MPFTTAWSISLLGLDHLPSLNLLASGSSSCTFRRRQTMLPSVLFFLALLLSPLPSTTVSAFGTTSKPGGSLMGALASAGSSGGSSNSHLSAALSGASAVASAAASASSAAGGSSGSGASTVGATSNFLYSLMGASPSAVNPYPIRTMIGNMVFRLRQHKTPLMVIPPVLRLLYQFRGPLMSGFNSAFKGIGGAGGPVGSAAAGLAAKGASDLASAASSNFASSAGAAGLSAAAGGAFGGAGAPFMFPGPAAMGGVGGALPGLFGPSGLSPMMPVFKK